MIDILIGTVLPFLAVLTVLVFIHEMGHYLVARWAGVKVEAFAVGFGREIFGFNDRHGTRWKFCWIPLGGYVKMFGDRNAASLADPDAEQLSAEERAVSFPHKPLKWRAAIVAAGPIANFLLAIAILAGLYLVSGVRVVPPVIGYVQPGSVAEAAGFQAGDRMVTVDGDRIEAFSDFGLQEQILVEKALTFEVDRDGRTFELSAVPERKSVYNAQCRESKINDLGLRPVILPIVGAVSSGSAAEAAGLKAGDEIIAVGSTPISHFLELSAAIRPAAGQQLDLTVLRADGGARETLSVTPTATNSCSDSGLPTQIGVLGVAPVTNVERQRLGPVSSIVRGTTDTWDMGVGTLRSIWQMITRDRGTEELGGPLGIANLVGNAASSGLVELLFSAAILSLNLGLINLFPIPVLDGGHLMLYGYEAARGKPLGLRAQEIAFRIGFALILSLMVFATANDFIRALS